MSELAIPQRVAQPSPAASAESTRVRQPVLGVPTRRVVLDLALHVVMIAVMVFTMAVDRSVPAALAGAAVLILASMGCAPLARRHPMVWDHLVDLWAMAVVIILMAMPAAGIVASVAASGTHAHSFTPDRVPLLIAAVFVWTVVRLVRGRQHLRGRTPADLWWRLSAVVSGLGLGIMVVLCLV